MGLLSALRGLLGDQGGDRFTVTPFRVTGSFPAKWQRDFGIIRNRSTGETFSATRSNGDWLIWSGHPHRTQILNRTAAGRDHAHLTRNGLFRDDSVGTLHRLGIDQGRIRMQWPRNRLSSSAMFRSVTAQINDLARVNDAVVTSVRSGVAWSKHSALWGRQISQLSQLDLGLRHLKASLAASEKQAMLHSRGLTPRQLNAKQIWLAAIRDAQTQLASAVRLEREALGAAKVAERAAKVAMKASEASSIEAAKAAEVASKQAVRAAEVASKKAVEEAEKAAKVAAKAAESTAKAAAKTAENAARLAAQAAEASAKATLMTAEATARGVIAAAGAAIEGMLGGN